jgi:NADPH:quinone reductase-like Zn-dependent oxidoreductase
MKAIVQESYGSPRILRVGDVDRPTPEDDAVLVRVRAASVNVLDWRRVRGSPFLIRLDEGLRRPKRPVLGVDTGGVVEEVGKDVHHLGPGDEVFGIGEGAFAEYTTGRTFVTKPANLSFKQAAAVPVAGLTALQAVRDKGRIQAGHRVLVNGAGGGVGTFTVQIAKAFGAEVTAVTRTASIDLVRSLGADHVIDHSREDFTRNGNRYDLIVEIGRKLRFPECWSSLTTNGRLIFVGAGGGVGGPIGRFVAASLRSRVLKQPVTAFVSWESTDDLLTLKDLIDAGKVTPVVERTYALSEAPEAVRSVESGGVRGKLVITV